MPAVSATQIESAIKAGLVSEAVHFLAESCTDYGLPFWMGCTILNKETSGKNIYGHDSGGTFSFSGINQEVTESNFEVFWRIVSAGGKSNGVGPMQLTWKGFFTNTSKTGMLDIGLRPWDIHDNIRYAVKSILAPAWKKQTAIMPALSLSKVVWNVGKQYNGKDSYADDAVSKARLWIGRVGASDQPRWAKV